ncbi:hypothetical protein PFICI_08488 [Pestalotiopsis fici W106-1]|uniref:DUF2264 domain-containing protein n=1 Tax=Pestalotiopsis fici (strain W106-1 / CGMCC3.15140) TaxID=1229662 RepID=W3X4M3_PESFW|nr:uncharacterized protein PFICI_08488 [Pestalotiopsis fici W106-1]ETS80959.1 hypothetical protein PFICI_08488 [Pestalotiopsis fici W106-1]
MPPLAGFSDNPFQTHSDLITAAVALIKPLEVYKSNGKARIKIASSSGAGFSETAAQVEGFSRPLWVVAHLLELESKGCVPNLAQTGVNLQSWVLGLKSGTDPSSNEYFGDLGDFDQRMVEMEAIALSILISPSNFAFRNDAFARSNLVKWLSQINRRKLPVNNWRWFRVFVNLALYKELQVPRGQVQRHLDEDLAILDSFYLQDGWSSDGTWGEERKQADYYSGSFAIQFAQLLFVKYATEFDASRADRYKQQAKEFATHYWRFFDTNGAAIPFGRSLTYRFAFAAFWSALSLAEVELLAQLNNVGVVKGLLLRHLRWWAKQPHIFNTDGTLNIGYTYANLFMSEDYNSPQSVYWCLKSFIAAAIHPDSLFWTSEEAPHPAASGIPTKMQLIWPAKQIVCNTPEHHFLLSSGQSTRKNHRSREAKYSKFAYSSAFAFSVPCGVSLEQLAPDSVLSLSTDGGETWKVRWEPFNVSHECVSFRNEQLPVLVSSWKPWNNLNIIVETRLFSPHTAWPGWSLRVHTLRWLAERCVPDQLIALDSGFAISSQTRLGHSIFEQPCTSDFSSCATNEGWWKDDMSCLIVSEAGASGTVDLTPEFLPLGPNCTLHPERQARIIKPDANTNLSAQRTLLPSSQHHFSAAHSNSQDSGGKTVHHIVTGVFAAQSSKVQLSNVWSLWQNRPSGSLDPSYGTLTLGG